MLALIYWAALFLTVVLLVQLWRKSGRSRLALCVAFTVFAFVAFTVLIYGLGSQSVVLAVSRKIFIVITGSVFLLPIPFLVWMRRAPEGLKQWFAFFICSAVGLFVCGFAGWHLVGDFAYPRRMIDGYIEHKSVEVSRRSGYYHWVFINGRRFLTTADVFETIQPGQRVRAEIGAGSGNIFRVETR